MESIKQFAESFTPVLQQQTKDLLHEAKTLTDTPEFEPYFDQVNQLIAGGKRLRPFLCYLGYVQAGRIERKNINSHLVGLELFHTFCLVHDDIIDKAHTRRGVKTIHARIKDDHPTMKDYADAQAVLIGDLIHGWSLNLMLTGATSQAHMQVTQMLNEVVLGQMLDVKHTIQIEATEQELRQKMELKTASYTFVRPFLLGMAYAGEENIPSGVHEWLLALGTTFQLQDDYLDLFGDPEVTGKPVLNDLSEGQHTFILRQVMEGAGNGLKTKLTKAFGRDLEPNVRKELQEEILTTGIEKTLRNDITQRYEEHLTTLETLDLLPDIKQTFKDLIQRLIARHA
jgi:geranylgeranyl diphosphate synthase type I